MIGQSNNAISLPTVSLYLSADIGDGSLSSDELSILISFCFGEAVFLLLVFMVTEESGQTSSLTVNGTHFIHMA